MPSLAHRSQHEILQESSLHKKPWPRRDPREVSQLQRTVQPSDIELVNFCATSVDMNMDVDGDRKGASRGPLAKTVHDVLTHQKFNFSPVGSVRAELRWRDVIQLAIEREQPIDVTYPLMCVTGNWAKRMDTVGPHAGEDCTFLFFGHLNRLIQRIYAPGLRFHVVCDARLYNSAFQVSEVEVTHYVAAIHERVRRLGLEEVVQVVDYTELICNYGRVEYLQRYLGYSERLFQGDESVLEGVNVPSLYASVLASINTRRLGMSYDDHRALFGPQDEAVIAACRFGEIVHSMANLAFREVVAVRRACSDVDVITRAYPDALRVTCHKAPKNGVWHVGLRCYPEYYGSCRLLPYHGMPLVYRDRSDRLRLEIHPEICLRGVESFVRVIQMSEGLENVYLYDASHLQPNEARGLIGS